MAVELRPGEKCAGQLDDLVGLAQLLLLAVEPLQALRLAGGNALARTRGDLGTLDPLDERLRHAADFGFNGFNGRSQRGPLAPVLLQHAPRALAHLG